VIVNNHELADTVAVQALGSDGQVVAEITTQLEFVRTGGSTECGGSSNAEVMLDIPATLEIRD
jgi:hypothetical protein